MRCPCKRRRADFLCNEVYIGDASVECDEECEELGKTSVRYVRVAGARAQCCCLKNKRDVCARSRCLCTVLLLGDLTTAVAV